MSILQEYEQIRKEIGEEQYRRIEMFLERHPEYFLSDVYYKESVYEEFKEEESIRQRLESLGNLLYGMRPNGEVIWPIEVVNEFSDKELQVCKRMLFETPDSINQSDEKDDISTKGAKR